MDLVETIKDLVANPQTISSVTGFIISSIASGALKEAGKEHLYKPIKEKVESLLTKEDLTIYNKFLDVPDSPTRQQNTTKLLETRLTENPNVANELAELINKLPQSEKTNSITVTGDGNITLQDISGGKISINPK
jgi:hypothetical protein